MNMKHKHELTDINVNDNVIDNTTVNTNDNINGKVNVSDYDMTIKMQIIKVP
jgi:hypothetical protein